MVPFVLGQHKIVFHGSRGNSDNQDVFVISQDGTQLEQLTYTTGRSQDPQWLTVPIFRSRSTFAADRSSDRLSHTRSESIPSGDAIRGDMTVGNHVIHFQQRTVGRDRLRIDHIERRGTDVAAFERGYKIACIDQRPPRRVDEHHAPLHGADALRIDPAFSTSAFPSRRKFGLHARLVDYFRVGQGGRRLALVGQADILAGLDTHVPMPFFGE